MKKNPNILSLKRSLIFWGVFLTLFTSQAASQAADLSAVHDLRIELVPAQKKLIGRDDITIRTDNTEILVFRVSENLSLIKVVVGNDQRNYSFNGGRLLLHLKPHEKTAQLQIRIDYSGVFDDPVPVRQKPRYNQF